MPQVVYKFVASNADSVKKAFDDVATSAKRSGTATETSAKKGTRARKRALSEQERAAKRAADMDARIQHRVHRIARRNQLKRARENRRALNREVKDAERAAERKLRVEKRLQERLRRQRIRERRSFRRGVGRAALGLAGTAAGFVGGVGAAVGVKAMRETYALQQQVTKLAVQMRGGGEQLRDPTKLRQHMQNVAQDVPGMTAAQVAGGVSQFVTATGEGDLGLKMAATFAETAQAADADVAEIAQAASQLFEQFDIKTVEGMQEALGSWVAQGKKGAFEMKDMASQINRMAAAAQFFGNMKGAGSAQTLGGLAQIARGATGSPEQAATAVARMFSNLTSKSEILKKKHGVDIRDKSGAVRDPLSVIKDLITKVGGKDMGKKKAALTSLLGLEGIKAISPIFDRYAQALKNGADGGEAMDKMFKEAIHTVGDYSDVQQDAATMQETDSSKMTAAWARISSTIGDRLMPVFSDVADAFVNLVDETDFADDVGIAFEVLAESAKFAAEALALISGKKRTTAQSKIDKGNKDEERARRRGEKWIRRARKGDQGQEVIEGLERRSREINAAIKLRKQGEKEIRDAQERQEQQSTFSVKGAKKKGAAPVFDRSALVKQLIKNKADQGVDEEWVPGWAEAVATKATEDPLAMRTDMRGIDLPLVGRARLTHLAANLENPEGGDDTADYQAVKNYMDNLSFARDNKFGAAEGALDPATGYAKAISSLGDVAGDIQQAGSKAAADLEQGAKNAAANLQKQPSIAP